MNIDKFINWDFNSVHNELEENNKQFGLVYSQSFEWGGGMKHLFISNSVEDIRSKILELTNGKYSCKFCDHGLTSDDFHSMNFTIYKSHHVKFDKK